MKDLINLIGENKHKVSSEKLDEMMITYLNNYINKIPNDYTLGFKFRKDVLHLFELLKKIKLIRDKVKILD